jgi:hypothetical protein
MADTYSRKPSLDDAGARVGRAGEHIARLEIEIEAALSLDAGRRAARNASVVVPAGTTGVFKDSTHTDSEPVAAPPIIPILIGEAAYNLKAALDYLVTSLFELDTAGERNGSTKFVIETSEKAWNNYFPPSVGGTSRKREKDLWLHRLKHRHQAALKGLQPFPGRPQWLLVLQRLTNPDKHSRLTWVRASITGVVVTKNTAGAGFTVPSAAGVPMGVEAQITGEVLFKEGARVVETLKEIERQAADVLKIFDPDFQ